MVKDQTRPFRHRVADDPNGIRIILPVKPQRFRMLLHLVWSAAWILFGASVLWIRPLSSAGAVSSDSPPRLFVILGVAVFLAGGIFVVWRWLWYLAGTETIRVDPRKLSISRGIAGLRITRGFEIAQIKDLRVRPLIYKVIYPSWGRMFVGHGDSQILFDDENGFHAFARGLTFAESKDVLEALKKAILTESKPPLRPTALRLG
jgi:hypothetical protein